MARYRKSKSDGRKSKSDGRKSKSDGRKSKSDGRHDRHVMMTRSQNKKKHLRIAILFKVENLDKKHINVSNFHKSLCVMNITLSDFRKFEPYLQRYLESKKKIYKTLKKINAKKIVCKGKYKMLKFPEELTDKLDKMTIDFFNFLNLHGYLTPGTEENLPPWVLSLKDEIEKKLRKQLHLKYGTANAPPLQSHHITLNYYNEENGDLDCKVSLELDRIVVSETNMLGELVGPTLFNYVF